MVKMDAEIEALIKTHNPYLRALEDGKVECTLNGHAFAPNKAIIEAFLNGKKYQKLKRRKEAELELDNYKPFLDSSINFPGMLFCSLTNQLIVKSKDRIEAHMKGKRFANAKDRFDAKELELWVEPTLEEMDQMEAEMAEQEMEMEDAVMVVDPFESSQEDVEDVGEEEGISEEEMIEVEEEMVPVVVKKTTTTTKAKKTSSAKAAVPAAAAVGRKKAEAKPKKASRTAAPSPATAAVAVPVSRKKKAPAAPAAAKRPAKKPRK